jgi:hypothetical protein
MRPFRTAGFRPTAILIAFVVLTGVASSQDTGTQQDPAKTSNNSQQGDDTDNDTQTESAPNPVTTAELAYPRLAGRWAQGPLEPSLSEQFNESLPYWLRFSGEVRERSKATQGAVSNRALRTTTICSESGWAS